MKKRLIKQALMVLAFALICVGFGACNKNVLDKADQNGVDVAVVWANQSTVNEYLNALYDLAMPNWPTPGSIHNTSDELGNATVSILNGTLTGSTNEITDIYAANKEASIESKSGDVYYLIYRCNNAIQNLGADSPLTPDLANPLRGQFYFFRAYIYFLMVRIYGGVPLVLQTQNPANGIPSLYVPRAKSSACFKQIAADLDSATALLPARWTASADNGRITRAVASAFKGKALLYWASPQFNPGNIQSRWQDAYDACKAAYTMAQTDGYGLFKGGLDALWVNENDRFATSNPNIERMMWRSIDNTVVSPAHGTNNENITRPVSETTGGGGSNQPTWNLVQAFPMANGLAPFNPDGSVNTASGYDATQYWLNRDPRFAQTIAYNGAIWNLSGKSNRHQWMYQNPSSIGGTFLDDASRPCVTGFYCRKICNPNISATQALYSSNTSGGSGMDWIELRFAEVLLNYAECANAIGNLGEAQNLVITLRQARGFTAGAYNYGLANITSQAAMASFLLTEREVEFAMEGKRYWDLRRTRQYDKLSGTALKALITTVNYNATTFPYVAGASPNKKAEANATGSNPPVIYMDVPNASGGRVCDTLNVNNRATYTKFFTAGTVNLTYSGGTGVINYPSLYYFYPLPPNFLQTSPALQQTIGWPGGSFDPLQ